MEIVILVAAVALVVMLVRAVRARKGKPVEATTEAGPDPGGQHDPRPATFKSGKTVLLASMFHHLNFVTPQRSYFLDVKPEQRIKLNTIYRTISDTGQGWPRGTRVSECTEYLFDCIAVDEETKRHHVLTSSCCVARRPVAATSS